MCGIAGILYADPARPVEPTVLKAMADAVAHRGPDAEGFWSEAGIGLAHRRLSIIDLASGDQPIGNEDGSVQVIFNGEIYNYHALRDGLTARGHRLQTHSDTEAIVHLYEEHGPALVEKLRGMFAFALWDRSRRSLVLARDRLGIKPLYVYRDAEKLLFASELKAILAHPEVARAIDPAALEDYFAFGMVCGPRTIFRRIEKLPPGHTLVVTADSLERKPIRYWQPCFVPDETRSLEDWCEALKAKVDETVRLHLIADVPVGAFLSGGIDSSVMVALASRHVREPLRTFSMGFEDESVSELPFARQVAARYGTAHAEELVTPDAVELLDELTHHFDEPFADTSAIPTYLVSRMARRSVKVVLSGDGGDELFGGYARYAHDLRESRLRGLLPGWLRRGVLGPLGRVWPKADWLPRPLRFKTALTNLALEADQAYGNTLSICRPPLRRRLLAPDLAALLNGHEPERVVRAGHALAPAHDALAGMIAADVATVLPDDFLVKVDRASMAHGLEVRPPLLDHELFELAARVPSRWKVSEGRTKWIFKHTFHNLLPPALLQRPKQGFEVPVDAWFRGPLNELFEEAVFGANSPARDFVNRDVIREVARAHTSGRGRHGNILWGVLVLARWAERYLSGAVV